MLRKEECPDNLVDMNLPSRLETDLFPGHTKIRPMSRPADTASDETIEEPDTSDQNRGSPESAVSSASGNRPNRHRPGHHKEPSDKKKPHGSRPGRGDPDASYPNSHRPDRGPTHSDKNPPSYVINLKPDELDDTEPISDMDDEYHDFDKPRRPGSKESKRPYEPGSRPDKSGEEHGPHKRPGEWSPPGYGRDTALEPYDQTEFEADGNQTGHKPRPPRRGDIGIQSLDEKSERDKRQIRVS